MIRIGILILLALPLWSGAQATPPPPGGSALLPPGAGRDIVERSCVTCHSLDVVTAERGSAAHWAQVINQMVGRGAELSDPEIDTVVKYLSSHFGPVGSATKTAIPSTSPGGSTSSSTSGRIDLNTATSQEIQSFLGLSQKQSEAIVEYRKKNGKFKTWQDVAAIPEETPNQIEALQDRLVF